MGDSMAEQARIVGAATRSLRVRWRNRDELYRRRSRPVMDAYLIAGIRIWRWHEAAEVGNLELMQEAEAWYPPLVLGE